MLVWSTMKGFYTLNSLLLFLSINRVSLAFLDSMNIFPSGFWDQIQMDSVFAKFNYDLDSAVQSLMCNLSSSFNKTSMQESLNQLITGIMNEISKSVNLSDPGGNLVIRNEGSVEIIKVKDENHKQQEKGTENVKKEFVPKRRHRRGPRRRYGRRNFGNFRRRLPNRRRYFGNFRRRLPNRRRRLNLQMGRRRYFTSYSSYSSYSSSGSKYSETFSYSRPKKYRRRSSSNTDYSDY